MKLYILLLSLTWIRRLSAQDSFKVNPLVRANEQPYSVPPFHGGDNPQILHSIQGYNSDAACRSPSNSAVVFVEFSENILEDYSDGARTPMKASCAPCKSGTRFSYAPLPRNQDLDELTVGDIKDIVVGGYRCVNNSNLCVEATDGSYYRANSDRVVIWPVPFLKNKKPVMLAVLDPTESLKELIGNKVEYGRNQIQSWAPMKYKKGHDHSYIEIEGISCNSCQGAMNHCSSISAPPVQQLRSNDWRVVGASMQPPGEAPVAPISPPVIEKTGYNYNGPETYNSDAYAKPQTSATEEPYSNLGYEENSVYIQPDGMNPYLDADFDKKQETTTIVNTEPMKREPEKPKAFNTAPRFSVFRSSPAPIPQRKTSMDKDDGREIEILDRQVLEQGPVAPNSDNIRRAPVPKNNFDEVPKTTTVPSTFAPTRGPFLPLSAQQQNVVPIQPNPPSNSDNQRLVLPFSQSPTEQAVTTHPFVTVTPEATHFAPNVMPTLPPILPPVPTSQTVPVFEPRPEVVPSFIQPQEVPRFVQPQLAPASVQPQGVPTLVQAQEVPRFVQPQEVPTFVQPQVVPSFIQPQQVPSFLPPQVVPSFTQPQQVPQNFNPLPPVVALPSSTVPPAAPALLPVLPARFLIDSVSTAPPTVFIPSAPVTPSTPVETFPTTTQRTLPSTTRGTFPTTTQGTFPTTQRTFPTTQRTFPTTQRTFPTTQRTFPTTQRTFPTTQQTFPTTRQTFPTTQQTVPTTQRTFPTTQRPLPTVQQTFATTSRPEVVNSPIAFNTAVPPQHFIFPQRNEQQQNNAQFGPIFSRAEFSPPVPTRTFAPIILEQSDSSKLDVQDQLKQDINPMNVHTIPPQAPTLPPQNFFNQHASNMQTFNEAPRNNFQPRGDFNMGLMSQFAQFPQLLSPIEQSLLLNSIISPNMNSPVIINRGQLPPREFVGGPAGPPGLSNFFFPTQIQDTNVWPPRSDFPQRRFQFTDQPPFSAQPFTTNEPTTTTTMEPSTTPFEFKVMQPQSLISGPVPPPKETAFEQKEVNVGSSSKDSPPSQVPTWQWLMDHPARMRALLRRRKMLL